MEALVARVEPATDANVVGALGAVVAAMTSPLNDRSRPVGELTRTLTGAVPAFLGFTVTVQTGLHSVSTTTANPRIVQGARACLLLLLSPLAEPGSSAVLYAAEPGAFDELAASDVWRSCSYDPVVLDQHLRRS